MTKISAAYTGTTQESAVYKGSAQDIGCQVFLDHVMPIIRAASKKMDTGNLAQFYAGLMAAACGSMAADFGKDAAQRLINVIAEQFGDVVQELDQGTMQ